MGLLDRAKKLKQQTGDTPKPTGKGLLQKALSRRPTPSAQEEAGEEKKKS